MHVDQQPLSWSQSQSQVSPESPPASGKVDLPNDTSRGTTPLPVQMSASGALLLAPYETKDVYMKQLQELKQTKGTLKKAGYVVQALTEYDLAQKRKCQRCHKPLSKRDKAAEHTENRKPRPGSHFVGEPEGLGQALLAGLAISTSGSLHDATVGGETSSNKTSVRGSNQRCKYHDGTFGGRIWSCCKASIYSPSCKSSPEHLAAVYQPGELERLYTYHCTPTAPPFASPCLAVAIDCEMGVSHTNDSVPIRVTLIDYFTSKVLIDKLVFPDEPLLHYNTRFSGVTYGQMIKAKSKGECLYGIMAVRNTIWKFVGPDTIVVAHAGQNDMSALRWIHDNVVDTLLVESLPVIRLQKKARKEEAQQKAEQASKSMGSAEKEQQVSDLKQPTAKPQKKPKGSGPFSLKTLTKERLGRDIQMGKGGHDSVEDAIAARDIAHWNVLNSRRGLYAIQSSTD